MLEMVRKAKRDYANITKIIIYTNSEWGQNKGKEPAGKKEIEQEAKDLGVEIDWRCGSYFESPFVVDENKSVCAHFFLQSDSVYKLLEDMGAHTNRVLDSISEDIPFNGKTVVIDRASEYENISSTTNNAVVISGEGGTGKTALIKSLHKKKGSTSAFYVLKATEFSVNKVEDVFSGVSLDDFSAAHLGADEKIVVVDSAENLLALQNTDPFREFVSGLLSSGWKVWFVTIP